MSAELIKIEHAHVPALQALAADIWWAHYPALISTEQIRFMLARMYSDAQLTRELDEGVCYRGLRVDGHLCGYFSVRADLDGGAWLDKLYLRPALHGRGHGQRMLRAAEQCAWQLGAARLRLRVNRHNDIAIAAYRRAGYALLGEDCADIGDGFVMDDFIFGLDAPAPDSVAQPSA
ncbi:N-acetyltransferase GCN5 [Alcanivorax sp. S71-1-4]|uniref:GNAT family N-acetyltransferase n=1 Tax=Alcanivorax sp. S71-1-4 TaxID=1177159 RepID=UPI00135AE9C1|nr:GNAT family N-acetyltransferase [Alcanivorax sp. S71-1-4]KAF0808994.1 N-acetyltransferase GCN5 [Alcanivorax sp. S71-1-4]